jgi:hypothetical protein
MICGCTETACSVGSAQELSGIATYAGASGIGEVSEELKDANGGKLDSGFGDFAAVIIAKVVEDEVEVGLHFFEPEVFFEVILEAAVSPAGEVGTAKAEAMLANFCNDGIVGKTVVEHGVNEVAKVLGKPGDVTIAAASGLMLWGFEIGSVHKDFRSHSGEKKIF